jgi:hypothetical protein
MSLGTVGGSSLGPGSPEPVAYNYRRASLGKPSIEYNPGANQVQSTVAQGKDGTKLGANYKFRDPPSAPGIPPVFDRGTFVDANA